MRGAGKEELLSVLMVMLTVMAMPAEDFPMVMAEAVSGVVLLLVAAGAAGSMLPVLCSAGGVAVLLLV